MDVVAAIKHLEAKSVMIYLSSGLSLTLKEVKGINIGSKWVLMGIGRYDEKLVIINPEYVVAMGKME
jgi:hypothetical protein